MQHFDSQTIQLALVAVVALAILIQAIVLLAAFIALRKLAKSLREEVDDIRSSVMPVIENARDLFTRLAPKVEKTTDDLAALTHALRNQTADIQTAANDILERTRRQASRIDSMLSSLLDAVDRASVFMADTVAKPMRQLSAVLASAKAVIESLRNSETAARGANHARGDQDLFV